MSTEQGKDQLVVLRSADDGALAQRAAQPVAGAEVTVGYRREGAVWNIRPDPRIGCHRIRPARCHEGERVRV